MPVIRLNITDDEEFTQCQYCSARVEPYNNTSLQTTLDIDNSYTKTLLKYHHLNCEKCGVFIEMHPKNPKEEGLIFLCPQSIPHRHCLCYECGLLYDLNANKEKMDLLNQLQFNNSTQPSSTQIDSNSANNNLLSTNNDFSTLNGVSNGTFIAEMMNSMAQQTKSTDLEDDGAAHSSMSDKDGSFALLFGTLIAFFVWFGIYLSSPELFRLSGCFVWLSTFYTITNLYFNDNELVQRAVFSLFSFSPIVAAIYIFDRTSKMNYNELSNDARLVIQFFCLFGSIAYFSMYWSPLDMYLFLVNDFMQLTMFERLISVFIAMSIGAFCIILVQNCKHLSSVLLGDDNVNEDDHNQIMNVSKNAELITMESITSTQDLEISADKIDKMADKIEQDLDSQIGSIKPENNKIEQVNKPKRKRRRRRRKKRVD
mmetsp:Transcript_61220/g.55217  ORF Transcript_61220/g.55217 Transcript_61220/m.55217 type:complete len:426 (+) Transcript_61220:136-1413(+)